MRWFHKKGNTTYRKTINVEMIWNLVEDGVYDKAKAAGEGGEVPVIDCVRQVRCKRINLLCSEPARIYSS